MLSNLISVAVWGFGVEGFVLPIPLGSKYMNNTYSLGPKAYTQYPVWATWRPRVNSPLHEA